MRQCRPVRRVNPLKWSCQLETVTSRASIGTLGRTHTKHDFPLVLGLQLLLAAGVDLLEGWATTDKRLA